MLVLNFVRFVFSLNFFNGFLATKGGVLRFLAFGYITCWFDCRVILGIRRTWRSSFLKHSMFNFNYISSAMIFHCFNSILLLPFSCGNKQNCRLFKSWLNFVRRMNSSHTQVEDQCSYMYTKWIHITYISTHYTGRKNQIQGNNKAWAKLRA